MLTAGLAMAADCDLKALSKEAAETSPTSLPAVFLKIVACSPDEARKLAPSVVVRLVDAPQTPDALLAAIRFGANESVRAWLTGLEPDVRSRMIDRVGKACTAEPAVGAFFLDAVTKDPDRFWKERWHRGLAECRTPEVRKLLTDALADPRVGRDAHNRASFYSLLEVYARNLGGEAIPRLTELLGSFRDEEEATLLVNVFADAARVTAAGPGDAAAARDGIAAIVAAGPSLPPRAAQRARDTLRALGDAAAASRMAKHRWPEAYVDGHYTYGVMVIEDFTCRNEEKRAVVHLGTVTHDGSAWPDEVAEPAKALVLSSWSPRAADKCKGAGSVVVTITDEPLRPAEVAPWLAERKEEQLKALTGRKLTTIDGAALAL